MIEYISGMMILVGLMFGIFMPSWLWLMGAGLAIGTAYGILYEAGHEKPKSATQALKPQP